MHSNIDHHNISLFPIGLGTWGIGGFATPDPLNNDKKQIDALIYMLQKGMNFIDTSMGYSQGKAIELLSTAVKASGIHREKYFLELDIGAHSSESISGAKQEIENTLNKLNTNYLDSLNFSMVILQRYGYETAMNYLETLLNEGIIKFVSLSNADLPTLKQF